MVRSICSWWARIGVFLVAIVLGIGYAASAYASHVYRGPEGYEWYSNAGNNYYNAYKRLDIEKKVIEETGVGGSKKVQYTLVWNKDKDQAAFSGRVWLFAFLPKDIQDNGMTITRYKDELKRKLEGGRLVTYWETVTIAKQSIGDFAASDSRDSFVYGEDGFNKNWSDGFGQTNPNKDQDVAHAGNNESTCEMTSWKDQGKFRRSLWSYENGTNTTHKWVVEAWVPSGFDIDNEPVLMGYNSSNTVSHEDFFMGYGPFDTDNDGLPDYLETKNKTNPFGASLTYKSEPLPYGAASSVKPLAQTGTVGNLENRYVFSADNGGVSDAVPTGATYTLSSPLPAGVSETTNKNHMAPGRVFLDPNTGELLFHPSDVHAGQKVDFEINVEFPQHSACRPKLKEKINASFTVKTPAKNDYSPQYADTSVQAGTSVDTQAPKDKDPNKHLPDGTKFTITEQGKKDYPWAKINEATGVITLSPDRKVTPKDYSIPVLVTYPDTSTATIAAKVTVTKPAPQKGDFTVKASETEVWVQAGHPFIPELKVTAQSISQEDPIDIAMVCSPAGQESDPSKQSMNGWSLGDQMRYRAATADEERQVAQGAAKTPGVLYRNDAGVARTDTSVAGFAQKAGEYSCAFFGSNKLDEIKKIGLLSNGKTNDASGLYEGIRGIAWDSATVKVHVVEPFELPKTGGTGVMVWLGLVCLGGTLLVGMWLGISQLSPRRALRS